MTLAVGTKVGPYEILAPIGAGGMGEVYRARDSKLNRDVALKILPEHLALDPDRLERFEREARVLASLNHPNIAAIYGFEDSALVQALVLELVEGRTLAGRIQQGPIPIHEALPVAQQIAEALEAARDQGVIHRDLKPANIKMRPDGTVKVLDFGLAKLAQPSGSGLQPSDLSQSPTLASPAATRLGVVMGTTAYMSPEQARGMPIDRRTDIWAFGCVFYEMLSGRPAFAGETISDTIARILEREPDWQALPASTPAKIRDLLRRCLQKDQRRRLQDIADARIEIEEARTALSGRRWVAEWPVVGASVVLTLTLLAGAWYAWRPIPSVQHEPVSVLIADFQNRTSDPTFDYTLEPLIRIVLEGAGFISAYDRTQMRSLGLPALSGEFDEPSARTIAVSQGLGVVVSGTLTRRGGGYELSLNAIEAVTGTTITSVSDSVSAKDQVVPAVTKLGSAVRTALGDETSESARTFAMETLNARSLDVIQQYALAMEALNNGKYEYALRSARKAAELDPDFGSAYGIMAAASGSLGRRQDAEKYIREAVAHLDRVTERERYRIRGLAFGLTGDRQKCIEEYSALISRYAADATAHNNLALCASQLRQMSKAIEEMELALKVLPKSVRQRLNLAVYASYNSDFARGEREAQEVQRLDPAFPKGLIALAFAHLGQGRLPEAAAAYEKLESISPSDAASGLADVALFEGRFSEAVRILEDGAAADVRSKNSDRAADKFAALAYTRLMWGQKGLALRAAESALVNSKGVKTRFLIGRILALAGEVERARQLAATLASELYAEPQAYAKIIEGDVFLENGDPRQAIKALTEANRLLDTWIGRFDLGRAFLQAEAYLDADAEFDRCIRRRGEAMALFLDEVPTYGYFPPVYYYLGRVREALKTKGFAESYRTYLDIRGRAGEDPFLSEAHRRAGP
jgi:serine/threonine protein kinase/tetratricopeptide (TPR) repeat protein